MHTWLRVTVLAGVAVAAGGVRHPPEGRVLAVPAELRFDPDPGVRLENASNSRAGVAVREDGTYTVYLYYEAHEGDGPGRRMVVGSDDGLAFDPGSAREYHPGDPSLPEECTRADPATVRMPAEEDGHPVWRRYAVEPEGVRVATSADGVHFTWEPTLAYGYHRTGGWAENDAGTTGEGTIGVHTVYAVPSGEVFLAYLGDVRPGGINNLRLAVSSDNGRTFVWARADVLGDAALARSRGSNCTFVDPAALPLPDGSVRLFTMTPGCANPVPELGIATGSVHTFRSWGGRTFVHEPGVRLAPDDFDPRVWGFRVISLNDPAPVLLPDGRTRIYVTALACDPAPAGGCVPGTLRELLVSATASAPVGPPAPGAGAVSRPHRSDRPTMLVRWAERCTRTWRPASGW